MKKLFALMAGIALVASATQATLIAYWNFNDFGAPYPATLDADAGVGSGSISFAGWDGVVTNFAGSTLNALFDDGAGQALTLASNAGNDSYIEISFSMVGYQDLEISFDTRGTGTGYDEGQWSWSTDGSNFTDFGPNTASRSTTFATAGPFGTSALDDAATAFLRYTLDGATTTAGNNRIDNLQLNATLIPEPGTLGLMALGLLGVAYRRRR